MNVGGTHKTGPGMIRSRFAKEGFCLVRLTKKDYRLMRVSSSSISSDVLMILVDAE